MILESIYRQQSIRSKLLWISQRKPRNYDTPHGEVYVNVIMFLFHTYIETSPCSAFAYKYNMLAVRSAYNNFYQKTNK